MAETSIADDVESQAVMRLLQAIGTRSENVLGATSWRTNRIVTTSIDNYPICY